MEVIREVYGDIDSSSEVDHSLSGNRTSSWKSITANTHTSSFQSDRTDEVWSLLHFGLQVRAFRRIAKNTLEIRFSSPGFPSFSLNLPEPIPPRTFIVLPGGTFLLAFSKSQTVCVWNLQESYTDGENDSINAVCDITNAMMRLDDQEYCQTVRGLGRSYQAISRDRLFSVEVTGAQIVSSKEAIIVVSVFKNDIVR